MADVRAIQSDPSAHSSFGHPEPPDPLPGLLRPSIPGTTGTWATHLAIAGGVSIPKRAGHHEQKLLLLQVAQPVLIHAENLHGTQSGHQPSVPKLEPPTPSPDTLCFPPPPRPGAPFIISEHPSPPQHRQVQRR